MSLYQFLTNHISDSLFGFCTYTLHVKVNGGGLFSVGKLPSAM